MKVNDEKKEGCDIIEARVSYLCRFFDMDLHLVILMDAHLIFLHLSLI